MRVVLIILLLPYTLISQDSLTANNFLRQKMEEFGSIDYRTDANQQVRFPWIEKIEFRSETHDFLLDEQEYMFRVSPGTIGEHRAQKQLYNAISQKPDFDRQDYLCDLSYRLQKDWLHQWYIGELKTLRNKQFHSAEQTDSLYNKGLLKTDPLKILDLRNRKTDLSIRVRKLDIERNAFLSLYGLENHDPDFSGLKKFEELIRELETQSSDQKPLAIAEIDDDLRVNELELKLEKAENRQVLDFMQMRYRGPKSDPLAERVSIGIGFILPNSGNQQLKIKELEVEAAELEQEKRYTQKELELEQKRSYASIVSAYELYKYKMKLLSSENDDLEYMKEGFKNNDLFNATLMIRIRKRLLENQIEILENKYDLYKQMLSFAKDRESICHNVEENFLYIK